MTPADERIVQLLAKWQKSLELHLRYTKLPDEKYWQLQVWPKHERPSRWIVELTTQRLVALQRIVQTRISAGDPSLSEALELMSFLGNLLGSEHLERHIPLAEDVAAPGTAPEAAPRAAKPAAPPKGTKTRSAAGSTGPGTPEPQTKATPDEVVITDAVRLMAWGKAWHELPEAIERMADRPNATAVRKILKLKRQDIERLAEEELDKK